MTIKTIQVVMNSLYVLNNRSQLSISYVLVFGWFFCNLNKKWNKKPEQMSSCPKGMRNKWQCDLWSSHGLNKPNCAMLCVFFWLLFRLFQQRVKFRSTHNWSLVTQTWPNPTELLKQSKAPIITFYEIIEQIEHFLLENSIYSHISCLQFLFVYTKLFEEWTNVWNQID